VLQCVAVCCSVLQGVAVATNLLREKKVLYLTIIPRSLRVLHCDAVCCSLLQCVAVCCSVL